MTPAETLLALCEDVEGLAGPHEPLCKQAVPRRHTFRPRVLSGGRELWENGERVCGFITRYASLNSSLDDDDHCSCPHAERLKALKALAAALKVCVERMKDESRCSCDHCHIQREGDRLALSEAARLASSEGEEGR